MKKLLIKMLKDILLFKIEYFVSVLMITLFILSLIYVGFNCTRDTIFNIMVFLAIPLVFFGLRTGRRMLYKVYFGGKNENK